MIALAIVAAALIVAAPLVIIALKLRRIAMDVATLLNQITAINVDLDILIAKGGTAPDLQPVADALTALDDKIKTATPAG